MKLVLLFEVGDRADLLRTIDDSDQFYSGEIVEIDEGDPHCPYKVKIDGFDFGYWCKEDELGAEPTREQIAQFAGLVARVYRKLVTREGNGG